MGSSVKLVTKDELTTGNYFNADNLIGGENTTIVKDGDVYKINAAAGESTTIESSDESITVTGTATGYDLKVDTGKLIDKNDNEIFGLSAANAGDNITITGSGSTLKINAAATVSYPHIADSDKVTISVNGSSDTFSFTADNISSLNTLIANKESYLTQNVADGRYANKTDLNYKQDQLTADNAGNNITITGSGSTLKINAEATASYPHITDSNNVIISVEGTSDTFNFTSDNISALNTLVSNSGNYLTQSTADARYAKTTDLSNKQDQLTSDNAGDNITITGSGSTLKINAATAPSYPHITDSNNVTISVEGASTTFSFTSGNISSLNRILGKDFVHLTRSNWGTMEDGGVYYVDMISDSGPFNFQTGLSMAAASGKVYTAELHIHYNENIDSPRWPNTWQWVDEDNVTQPTPVPSGSNGKWICYTVRSVNGFTLVHLDHIYGTAS